MAKKTTKAETTSTRGSGGGDESPKSIQVPYDRKDERSVITALHDQLKCLSYFGFGSGYALATWGPASDTGALYCNRCPVGTECWQRHRVRVARIFPELAAMADEIAKTHRGAAYFTEWLKRTGQNPQHCMEPYMTVMTGNLEDGMRVANGEPPAGRGPGTLSWPFGE